MSSAGIGIGLAIAAAVLEGAAQICLKLAATGVARSARAWLAAGVIGYVIEVALYTAALRWVDVSVAFPIGSLSFVGVVVLARMFLHESVSLVRWLGVLCIVAGTMLVAQ